MAYAVDIIESTFKKTKETFFPIRFKYWLKMGILNLFSGNGSGGNSSSSRDTFNTQSSNFREAVATFNAQALSFLSINYVLISIIMSFITIISLGLSYISSVFTFLFIDGLLKKEVHIKKGFSQNKKEGLSLFYFRIVIGIITLAAVAIILSPLLFAFFMGELADFNIWLLIPIVFFLVIFLFAEGIFLFLVNDFVVPSMYLKKVPFGMAWRQFSKVAVKQKKEIFVYWLFKILLTMAGALLGLLILIVCIVVVIPFVLIGILMYVLINQIGGWVWALGVTGFFALIIFIAWIILISAVSVPISGFFRLYSLEMLSKLEGKENFKAPQTRSSAASER